MNWTRWSWPRLPNLFYGYLKNTVYQTTPITAEDLKDRIRPHLGCFILIAPGKYLEKYERNEKS